MSELCVASVSDHTGYHFHRCHKPAKWWVWQGKWYPRCGLHARPTAFKALRVPITATEQERLVARNNVMLD